MNFDILNRQSLQYHPRSGGHCINQFSFVADGACPHLSYFNLAEKIAGTSGGICEEVEGIGCTMSGGQVIGSTGKDKGLSRCLWVKLSLFPVGTWVA